MRLLCVVPVSCRIVWFLLLFACKSRCLYCLFVAFSTGLQYFTEPSRNLICIRVFDFYLLQPDSL
jgi:hypothetical protein